MIELGRHWEFIVAAYAGAALIVGGLIGWVVFSSRAASKRVEFLEAARQARRAK